MFLRVKYELTSYPYTDEIRSKDEKWSKIKLILYDNSNNWIKNVLDWQWDIIVVLKWFLENESSILHEQFPLTRGHKSIAGAIFDFYEDSDLDEDNENIFELMFSYRERHGLRFAFRGTDIADIYIGFYNSRLTISYYKNEQDQWSFDIEGNVFFEEIRNAWQELGSDNSEP